MPLAFWDSKEIILIDYNDKDASITGEYNVLISERLKEAIEKEMAGKINEKRAGFARLCARPQEPNLIDCIGWASIPTHSTAKTWPQVIVTCF